MLGSRLARAAFAAIVTLTLCLLVTLLRAGAAVTGARPIRQTSETAFVCPMHPDYTLDIAGKCPRCGMALVRAAPFDVRDYRLDFRTDAAVVQAGQKRDAALQHLSSRHRRTRS